MENVILGDRYQLLELIGVGGMAKVYKAIDKLLQRQVAVKILKDQYAEDEDFLKKFSNEAQSAAKLSHVNIVSVYDIGQDLIKGKKVYYIVMEYVEGQTLKDLIDREGKLSNHDLTDFSIQIAQALKSAHSYNIVHRDIKPQNILIDKYGLLKVTDFGIARVSTNATITYTSSILGTVHYISPEQAKGKFVDSKSDLYSLGVVMYEMATGKVPFDADNSVGIAIMHIQDEPVRPKELNPNLSDHIDRIIMKLLSKDPMNRFTSAKDLIDALEDENYVFDEEIIEKETARIPIVDDEDSTDKTELIRIDKEDLKKKPVYLDEDEKVNDEDEEDKDKEAVYVTPSEESEEKKKPKKKKKKKSSILPLAVLAILLLFAVIHFFNKDKSQMVDVPAAVSLTEEEAVKEIESKGLKANISRYAESESYEKGTVMEQDPLPKTKVKPGTTVNLIVSQGKEVKVPDLSGMTLVEAEDALDQAGLALGKTKTEYSDTVEKDLVISQKPEAADTVQSGGEVDLVISLGEKEPDVKLVRVPNVVGQTEQNARTLLDNNSIKANVNYDYSDDVAEGLVISQSIAADTQVAENTQMDLTVSRGKDPSKEEKDNSDDSPVVNVEFNLDPPQGKDNFNVKIYKVESDGSTSDLLYNQNHSADEVGDNGKISLNFKAVLGTKVQIRYDNEPIGVYEVQR
ncbi:MAG: Stk1 family PASTA domain-containing Ser/Thr kinase [Peptoniphilaceae bacterium]|nr:Stk1 family PASTA domain-containing Ser/Thr kinase [Peptoniphilaceae bacterium]